MNVHDSEKLAGMLQEIGYEETQELEEADIILFNTCCVREHAEQRVYGNVTDAALLRTSNPNPDPGCLRLYDAAKRNSRRYNKEISLC